MGMGFAPTWLRQVSPPPPASQNHFNHWPQAPTLHPVFAQSRDNLRTKSSQNTLDPPLWQNGCSTCLDNGRNGVRILVRPSV